MRINGSFGLFVFVAMLIFMLLAEFGALSVPFVVWIVWTLIGSILVAIGR